MTIIILNPHANSGRACRKWEKIEAAIRQRLYAPQIVPTSNCEEVFSMMPQWLATKPALLIAAGGDGTVNVVLNALMHASPENGREQIAVGAIGLGSSNDFHKPLAAARMIDGVPFRLNANAARQHDLGKVTYRDAGGNWRQKFFIVNASIGVTAAANWRYNSGERLIEWLQRRSVAAAILWTTLKTITRYHNIPATISLSGPQAITTAVTNLGVIKNPHFAGDFCYDTPIAADSGDFGVNLCERMNFFERLKILYHLAHHSFCGRAKTWAGRTPRLHFKTAAPVPIETDGEVVMTDEAQFEILPQALRVCQ